MIVDGSQQVTRLRETLRGVRRLAVDTESNSLYAYQERVCLIQLSTDEADFLIDPLAFESKSDLAFLGEVFADPGIEKVFHAAEGDIMGLRRDFAFTFASIFDTMIAARNLGWQNFGLAALLAEFFGVTLSKSHQRADWGRRPLTPALVQYAQQDTHYLLPLRDHFAALLAEQNLMEEAQEMFGEVCRAQWQGGGFDPEGFWQINGARDLDGVSAAVLRELYLYRDQIARKRDLPVFKVMGDAVLTALASAKPRSVRDLQGVRGMTDGQIARHGRAILDCVRRGLAAPPLKPPRRRRSPDDLVVRRFEALHDWRKGRAAKRGVPSDVILTRDALWELAEVAPRTLDELAAVRTLGPWRLNAYGEEILRVLARLNGDRQR